MRFPSATRLPVAEDGEVLAAQVAAAKRLCAMCPVRSQCLEFAMRAMPDGIAGGMTPQERRVARAADKAERSHGGNRAPLLISRAHNPLAGTRALEGHRG
ncbi:WhiB family transcriptional regulator [Pseudonocardia sp. GCM10023141]|uniref:WhiB family transcriptional regulator n=1 Tax=Pseudonocardia sp. GCM10023141 TaxID=3252653 RepID=UPI0036112110